MNLKYTLDDLRAAIRKYKTISEFRKQDKSKYEQAIRRGLLPEIRHYLTSAVNGSVRQMTDEEIQQHALKFETRAAWKEAGEELRKAGQVSPYNCATRRGPKFFAACCTHMRRLHKKYTDEDLRTAARNFQTRGDWKKGDPGAYEAARRRPIFEECCAHMLPAVNPYSTDYTVYAYEFSDNHCYVGLTVQPARRQERHMKAGPVHDHLQVNPGAEYKVLATGLMHLDAIKAEQGWQDRYKAEGWTPLHTAKAGGLGSIRTRNRWTVETVTTAAQAYRTRKAFIEGAQAAYKAAKRLGCLEEACAHMPLRDNTGYLGRTFSAETRAKMRQAKIGRTLTAEHKAKIGAAQQRSQLGMTDEEQKLRDAIEHTRHADPAKAQAYTEMADAIAIAQRTGNAAHLERFVEQAEHRIAVLEREEA